MKDIQPLSHFKMVSVVSVMCNFPDVFPFDVLETSGAYRGSYTISVAVPVNVSGRHSHWQNTYISRLETVS
jgi:hypothetical protein